MPGDHANLLKLAPSRGLAGFIVAGAAGIVALLAFFALPFASLGGFVSFTGAQVAGWGAEQLWLVPLMALGAVTVSAWSIWGRTLSRRALKNNGLALGIMGGVSALLLFVSFLRASDYASFIGGGFWMTLLASIVIGFGGYGASRACNSVHDLHLPEPPRAR